jgi:hypothetical protein
VLVLELAGLSDSLGEMEERDEAETEALGAVDFDSAALVDSKAVPERLGVAEALGVSEADPESV